MNLRNPYERYQQNMNINLVNKEEEEEKEKDTEYRGGDKIAFALKMNYITKDLVNFCKNHKKKELYELLYDLAAYKIEKKNYNTINFKQTLFEKLEQMLIEISCLKKVDMQSGCAQNLFLWYKRKMKTYEDLKKIQEKSYKEKDEIDDMEQYLEKEAEKNQEEENNNIIMNDEEKNVRENLKHRNRDMLFKDMLQDYKRKQIKNPYLTSQPKTSMDNAPIQIKNEKLMSKTLSSSSFKNYSHTGELTTFYSTRNGKNAFTLRKNLADEEKTYYSLLGNTNKKSIPPLNRETKYSYSYNRPEYDYNLMLIENNIIQNKMKELREKRTNEEMKEKLNLFGKTKAKYHENIVNKYELKNIIKMYSNTNDFNSSILQKYKYITPNAPRDMSTRAIWKSKSNEMKDNSFDEKMKENKNKNELILNDFKRGKRSYSQILKKTDFFFKEKPKIDINQVKNIDNNSKTILEKEKHEIKVSKIKMKETIDRNKRYFKLKENYYGIPNDTYFNILSKNPLFKQKFLYDKMCNVKFKKIETNIKEDTEKDESESEYHNFYMSAYDFGNIKKLGKFSNKTIEFDKSVKKRNKDTNIIEAFESSRDNFLNFRKTMDSWKKENYEKLYNRLRKSKDNVGHSNANYPSESRFISSKRKNNIRLIKQNSLENALINPNEQNIYPRYFLPRSGSMLLKRRTLNEKKGKSKKKKK